MRSEALEQTRTMSDVNAEERSVLSGPYEHQESEARAKGRIESTAAEEHVQT